MYTSRYNMKNRDKLFKNGKQTKKTDLKTIQKRPREI